MEFKRVNIAGFSDYASVSLESIKVSFVPSIIMPLLNNGNSFLSKPYIFHIGYLISWIG
jgi:hypothetical protein